MSENRSEHCWTDSRTLRPIARRPQPEARSAQGSPGLGKRVRAAPGPRSPHPGCAAAKLLRGFVGSRSSPGSGRALPDVPSLPGCPARTACDLGGGRPAAHSRGSTTALWKIGCGQGKQRQSRSQRLRHLGPWSQRCYERSLAGPVRESRGYPGVRDLDVTQGLRPAAGDGGKAVVHPGKGERGPGAARTRSPRPRAGPASRLRKQPPHDPWKSNPHDSRPFSLRMMMQPGGIDILFDPPPARRRRRRTMPGGTEVSPWTA